MLSFGGHGFTVPTETEQMNRQDAKNAKRCRVGKSEALPTEPVAHFPPSSISGQSRLILRVVFSNVIPAKPAPACFKRGAGIQRPPDSWIPAGLLEMDSG